MSKELKPCPFCGGKNVQATLFSEKFLVACGRCGSSGSLCKTKSKAVTAWNTRQPDTELVRLLDRVITSVGRAIPAKLRIDIDEALDSYKEKNDGP